jgi:glycine cleavage system H protein
VATVRGCNFPEERFYDVANHVWYSPLDDGTLRVGMTSVAIVLAREVLVFTPKRVGRDFEKNRSFATVESAKWVGSVRSAFDGVVLAVNEALIQRPTLANSDPYGEGWMLIVRPSHADWRAGLVAGADVGPAYEAWMESDGFAGCGECPSNG